MSDALTDALNAPAGRLAEVLLKKLPATTGGELPPDMRRRLETLIDAPGRIGFLARIRLAAEVALLFDRAPAWTTSKIVPLFEWTNPDATEAWASRKYANYIGPPELFKLTKASFLAMFSRNDIPAEDLDAFAEWLVVILITNQSREDRYALTANEARSALRRAGVRALRSVGHRLALEMERAKPEEKTARWRSIVGPVFQAIWPLDIELQTSETTFKLTQILLATGPAFPEAAAIIVPFIRPDKPDTHSTVFSIAEASEQLYSSSPGSMLDLIAAIVGDASPRSVFALDKALERLRAADPKIAETPKFRKLSRLVD